MTLNIESLLSRFLNKLNLAKSQASVSQMGKLSLRLHKSFAQGYRESGKARTRDSVSCLPFSSIILD